MKRKWPIRGWITGVLVGIFLLITVAGMTLAADIAPHLENRVENYKHTTVVKDIKPFTNIVGQGGVEVTRTYAPDYAVKLHYFNNPDLSKLKIEVRNNVLYIDASALTDSDHCTMLCAFPDYDLNIEVFGPDFENSRTTEERHRPIDSDAEPNTVHYR